MNTTRRTLLAGLAALPATSIAMPSAPGADAALISAAALVIDLTRHERAAANRILDIQDREFELRPEHPTFPSNVPGRPPVKEASAAEMREKLPGIIGACNPEPVVAGYRARVERMEAYEASCNALEQRLGLGEAENAATEALHRLKDAVRVLTGMTPTTLAGVAHKARAVEALTNASWLECSPPDWCSALAQATIRDVVAVAGGVA